MPEGTTELQQILKDAADRIAAEKKGASPAAAASARKPAARKAAAAPKAPSATKAAAKKSPATKAAATKRTTAKAAAPKATAPKAATAKAATAKAVAPKATRSRPAAAVVAPVVTPAAAPVEPTPPPVDLDAIDDAYAVPAAPAPAAPVSPPPPPAMPSQWQPTPPPPPAAPSSWQPPASQPAPVPYSLPFSAPEKRRSKAVVVGAIVAGLLVAGGGTGVILATMGGAPSKAEYVKKADAACVTSNAPVAAMAKPTSYPELATASGVLATASGTQVVELKKLERPGGGDGAAAQAFLVSLDGTTAAAQKLQAAAGAKDDAATIAGTHALGAAFNDVKAKAAVLGLTACGTGMVTGVDSLYAGSSGVVKTAYIAKADTLCRTAARAMDNVALPRNDTGREFARFLNAIFAVGDKLLVDIKALPVPPGDEATVAAMVAAQDQVNVKSRDLSAAAAAEDESRFAAADRAVTPLVTAADAKWDAYGLSICGSNFGEY